MSRQLRGKPLPPTPRPPQPPKPPRPRRSEDAVVPLALDVVTNPGFGVLDQHSESQAIRLAIGQQPLPADQQAISGELQKPIKRPIGQIHQGQNEVGSGEPLIRPSRPSAHDEPLRSSGRLVRQATFDSEEELRRANERLIQHTRRLAQENAKLQEQLANAQNEAERQRGNAEKLKNALRTITSYIQITAVDCLVGIRKQESGQGQSQPVRSVLHDGANAI